MAGGLRGPAQEPLFPPQPQSVLRLGPGLHVPWTTPGEAARWYTYTVAGSGAKVDLLADHGVDDSPFVWCELSAQIEWPKGVWGFYPLFTYGWTNFAGAAPVNLLLTPTISVSVNAAPLAHFGGAMAGLADLKGGQLRFWVAEWNSKTNHAVYSYLRTGFELGQGGWIRSSVTLLPDPAAWERHAFQGHPRALAGILAHPQQWGVAILGCRDQERPEGYLGFDELRVARRFQGEPWDEAGAGSGWRRGARPVERLPEGGVGNSGWVAGGFHGGADGQTASVDYPLWTLGSAADGTSRPVNLLSDNVITVAMNATPGGPADPGSRPPAELKGGTLGFFVGRWHEPGNHAFYRYRRGAVAPGAGGWSVVECVLSPASEDWELYAAGTAPVPAVRELLADPQQWGWVWFGGTASPTGDLGFDALRVDGHAQGWNLARDAGGWRSPGTGSGPAPAQGRPADWRPDGGVGGGGGFVVGLADLVPWSGTSAELRGVLYTTDAEHWPNLLEHRRLRVAIHPAPVGGAGVADLGGGRLAWFVGAWEAEDAYAFYCFRTPLAVPSEAAWTEVSLEWTTSADDWWVIDSRPASPGAVPGRDRFPLGAVLRRSPCWGWAIVGAARPLSGALGFDELRLDSPPAVPPRLALVRVGGGVELTWPTSPGQLMELWSAGRLGDGSRWSMAQIWDDGLLGPPVLEGLGAPGGEPERWPGRFMLVPSAAGSEFHRVREIGGGRE